MLFQAPSDEKYHYHSNLLIVQVKPSSAPLQAFSTASLIDGAPGFNVMAQFERAGLIKRIVPLDQQVLPTHAAASHVASLAFNADLPNVNMRGPLDGVRIVEMQPGANLVQMQAALAADPHVESVSQVARRYLYATRAHTSKKPRKTAANMGAAAVPPPANTLWNLKKIQWSDARAAGLDIKTSINVAVLDTGVDPTHPDLAGTAITYVHDYPGSPSSTSDKDIVGHGTHVSGTISAIFDNGVGIDGICSCNLSVYKIFGDEAEYSPELGYFGYFVDPVLYHLALSACITAKCDVVNLSIGGPGKPGTVESKLFQTLINQGTTVVAAMGNDASGLPSYPAAIPGVIAVGASSLDDTIASFSNHGSHIALCAPGVGVWSTLPTYPGQDGFRAVVGPGGTPIKGAPIPRETDYDAWAGTSMATPHVTAAAALVLHKDGAGPPANVKKRLMNAVDQVAGMGGAAFTKYYGSGRLNLTKIYSTGGRRFVAKSAITFMLQPGLDPAKHDRVLAAVRTIPGVEHVAKLSPNSEGSELGRMAYASLAGDADASMVLGKVNALPEIESAEIAAKRGLA